MNLRDIAKSGIRGRKKDSNLIKGVITLSFAFIVISIIFQSSIEQTKVDKRRELYGSWHAAYFEGTEETLTSLSKEDNVDKIGHNQIIGVSNEFGTIGTFDNNFLDMANFTLYKGTIPKNDNEIMVELSMLSSSGLNLDVGDTITVTIENEIINEQYSKEIEKIYAEAINKALYLRENQYHENPSVTIGDIGVIVSSDYRYFFVNGEKSNTDTIKKSGFLTNRKVIFRKDFIISGILNAYSDKWDAGGHPLPNSYITSDAGEEFIQAFYNNGIEDVSDYIMKKNIFIQSNTEGSKIYNSLYNKYPDMPLEGEEILSFMMRVWNGTESRYTDLERAKILEYYNSISNSEDEIYIPEAKRELGNTSNFRRNSFTYEDGATSIDKMLTKIIFGIIFITTFCAVCQIFLTQIKNRSRKIALLKSIGATNSQIIGIVLWEGYYILRSGICYGIPIGLLTSIGFIQLIKSISTNTITLSVPYITLILGGVIGILALILGILIPTFYATSIPLTGTLTKPPRRSSNTVKERINPKKRKVPYQNLKNITIKYLKANKIRELLSFGLSVLIIGILTLTMYLCYLSFDSYREKVVENNKPDYVMEAIYGESQVKINEYTNELLEIQGVQEIETFKYGNNMFLWYEGIDNNKILNTYKDLLPETVQIKYFSEKLDSVIEQPEYISRALITQYYGVDTNSDVYEHILNSVTEGTIDIDKFKSGEEVIILVPMHKEIKSDNLLSDKERLLLSHSIASQISSNSNIHNILKTSGDYITSLNRKYKNLYDKQTDIKPGDTLKLSINNEKIEGNIKVNSFTTKEVSVGGIIYYFVEEGQWPFTEDSSYYTVIGSMNGMEDIYSKSKYGLVSITIEQIAEMTKILYPNSYGKTQWNIYSSKVDNPELLDAQLQYYANDHGFRLTNYRESIDRLYVEALSNAIFIALLGIMSVIIGFIVLYNIEELKVVQDKNRIGILQSLGVNKRQLMIQHFIRGIIQGFRAFLLSNLILFIILMVITYMTNQVQIIGLLNLFENVIIERFWLYPWIYHLLISGVYVVLTAYLQVLPVGRIADKYPVENIRSLGR